MVEWEELCDRADATLSGYGPIKGIADALKVKPVVIFAICMWCLLAFLLYGFGGQLICNLVGLAYPGFESFKAIESEGADAMRFWLTYWVVFAAATLMEGVYYYVLVWLPFYYPLKLAILVWLFSSSTRGAEHLYSWLVAPVLHKNRDQIDSAIEVSKTELRRGLSSLPQTMGTGAAAALAASADGAAMLRKRSRSLGGLWAPAAEPEDEPKVESESKPPTATESKFADEKEH